MCASCTQVCVSIMTAHWHLRWELTDVILSPGGSVSQRVFGAVESGWALGCLPRVWGARCLAGGGHGTLPEQARWTHTATDLQQPAVADCQPPRGSAQGVPRGCFVPHKHLAARRQGMYFTGCVPLQGACRSQGIMLIVHLQSSEGFLRRPMAPAVWAGCWFSIAHSQPCCLSLPSSTHQSPPEETEAGAFTVSLLKMRNQMSEREGFKRSWKSHPAWP